MGFVKWNELGAGFNFKFHLITVSSSSLNDYAHGAMVNWWYLGKRERAELMNWWDDDRHFRWLNYKPDSTIESRIEIIWFWFKYGNAERQADHWHFLIGRHVFLNTIEITCCWQGHKRSSFQNEMGVSVNSAFLVSRDPMFVEWTNRVPTIILPKKGIYLCWMPCSHACIIEILLDGDRLIYTCDKDVSYPLSQNESWASTFLMANLYDDKGSTITRCLALNN